MISRSRHLVVAVLIFAENDEVCVGMSMFGLDLDYMPVQISMMKMMKCVWGWLWRDVFCISCGGGSGSIISVSLFIGASSHPAINGIVFVGKHFCILFQKLQPV